MKSSISVKGMDGLILTIYYYHSNEHLTHIGQILQDYYSDYHDALALVNLGNISKLDKSIECPEGHTFDNRVEGYTVAYHRDRGDKLHISYHNTIDEIWHAERLEYNCYHDSLKYSYYHDGLKWYIGGHSFKEVQDFRTQKCDELSWYINKITFIPLDRVL